MIAHFHEPLWKARPDGIVDPLIEPIEKVMEIHEGKAHLLKGGGLVSDLPVSKWDVVESTQHGFAARLFDDSMRSKDPEVEGSSLLHCLSPVSLTLDFLSPRE